MSRRQSKEDGSSERAFRFPASQFLPYGTDYVIDLNDEHANQLRHALREYVTKGHRTRTGRQGRRSPSAGPETSDIRRWAQEHGYKVNARGRIQADVMQAYQQANN